MILLRRRFDADDRRVISTLIHRNILCVIKLAVADDLLPTTRQYYYCRDGVPKSNRLPRFNSQRRVWQRGSVFNVRSTVCVCSCNATATT